MRGSLSSLHLASASSSSRLLLTRQTVHLQPRLGRHPRSIPSSAAMASTGTNAWVGVKGPGSLDLRSDVMTVPTPSMLAAISRCTLRDDVFNEDPTTQDLEAHVAKLAGKEAGLFVLSGTMGNQVALRSLLVQPPHGVLADHRSHIILYEAGGVSSLTGATVKPVVPKNGIHLTLEDIQANAIISDNVHDCPTRVISLENTLNGMVMPLSEARRISDFARRHGIKMHCDGARLWEAVASGAGSLDDFCALFDTVSLCFSKGLGAPVGSMVVGEKKTLDHARWTRKSIGGGMRQPGFITAVARVAVDETFGTRPDGSGGLLKQSHEMAKRVEALWTGLGGKLVHPVHTNMAWVDLEAAGCSLDRFVELGKEEGLALGGGRMVTHYQVAQNGDEVLKRLERVFKKVLA
ncbi:pyridoxal phosphate-dependent transferase [Trichoderma novae-zelandiae]